jgi:hypothetical protein
LPGTTPPRGQSGVGNSDTIPSNHHRTDTVTDPQIVCPKCSTEIKLTESLAAPIEQAKRDCRHDEHIHRSDPVSVVAEERPPALRRIKTSP